ncbi:MAG: ferrochelatase [Rhabdochlamydiaceae bacterium]
MSTKTAVILVNFGGPRNINEIGSFLTELLTDVDVIRTHLPRFFERWFFKRVALKRIDKIAKDYELIGGKSPLFEDTERLAKKLHEKIDFPVMTFHRYLPATHMQFLDEIIALEAQAFVILPMYPQFSYSTTGSIARFFERNLPNPIVHKMQWIQSYATYRPYIEAMQNCIQDFLHSRQIEKKEIFLFFSAHGLPQLFVDQGDPYQDECQLSYKAIMEAFPEVGSLLAFQSKFGPGEWLRPYTSELSSEPSLWSEGKKHIVFVPLSFTSDHLETLYEIEHIYLPNIRAKGFQAHRCPALNQRVDWIDALISLVPAAKTINRLLIRT